jgi:hypothetical protein
VAQSLERFSAPLETAGTPPVRERS